jgi:hypothetical protein
VNSSPNISCGQGRVEFHSEFVVRFNYGATVPWVNRPMTAASAKSLGFPVNTGMPDAWMDHDDRQFSGGRAKLSRRLRAVPVRRGRPFPLSSGYGENGFLDLGQPEMPDHLQIDMR